MVEKIIAKERPDALLPTMGGQTALNTALKLADGRRAGEVRLRADRREGRGHRQGRGPPEVPRRDVEDRHREPDERHRHIPCRRPAALEQVGLPCVIRPSFTLGGTGGGIAYNREEFEQIVAAGLAAS
jgi:carbamoyl-phosphate synthase large subunit